jgi:hypothetical protein
MKLSRAFLILPLLLAACGDGLSVDFTLRTAQGLGTVTDLSFDVSGGETYSKHLEATKFSGGEATLRYVPKVGVGAHLVFAFHVVADTAFTITREITLRSGHNVTDVVLDPSGGMPDDMGTGDGDVDLAPMPCTSSAECSGTTPICNGTNCVACAAAAECTGKDPSLKYCDPDGTCRVCQPSSGVCQSAAMLMACNADGSAETPTTCVGDDCNGCTGACGASYCDGKDVATCDQTGAASKVVVKTCTWACESGGCLVLLPSHFDKGSYDVYPGATDLVTGGQTIIIDTKTNPGPPTVKIGGGAATNWPTYSNGADTNNVTLVVGKLTVGAGDTIRVLGARNLLLAAEQDVVIDGTIDASGHVAGPFMGPGPGASTTVPANTTYTNGGRGGGGHATAGGTGGTGDAGISAGIAGVAALTDTNLAGTFKAGTRGPTANYGAEGYGGGALQITSLGTITINATGKVLANGGGGGGGMHNGMNWPSNGGGAGGSLLIEARTVNILGVVAANGGSGGGISDLGAEIAGVDGQASKVQASPQVVANQCLGGKGGAAQLPPTTGGNGVAAASFGCGGGGSYGRILIRVLGALPTFPMATISPDGSDAFTINNVMSASSAN